MYIQQFQRQVAGGSGLTSQFQRRLDEEIEEKFASIKRENELKRSVFIVCIKSLDFLHKLLFQTV